MTNIANSPIEAYEQRQVAIAKDQGFALFCVKAGGGAPGFVYSVGMCQSDLPELLSFYPNDNPEQALTVISSLCKRMILGMTRFTKFGLLGSLVHNPVNALGTTYTCDFLKGDALIYAYKAYTTRALLFKQELGFPKGVLLVQNPEVPTLAQIRAQLMFNGVR